MKNIVRVNGYQLSDGRVISDKNEALKLQTDINFREELGIFMENCQDIGGESYNVEEDIQKFIIKHADRIEEILKIRNVK